MRLVHMLMLSVLVALPAVQAAAFEVFQDPNQDGVSGALPVPIPIGGGSATLYLYYDNGDNASVPPETPCLDGAGDEVCGWDIHIRSTSADVTLDAFAEVGDVVWAITESPNVLRANGGEYQNGLTGAQPIGQLTVSATAGGQVIVDGNLYVSASLTAEPVPGAVLAEATSDQDGDGIDDTIDNCPTVANPGQEDVEEVNAGRAADGVGDACDNCTQRSNPPQGDAWYAANLWAHNTGGQRDDDMDGYGNKCDGKFTTGTLVGPADTSYLLTGLGKLVSNSQCGPTGDQPCGPLDVNEEALLVGPTDTSYLLNELFGKVAGPKCAACPLPEE